jgi:hypothetical protein
MNEFEAIRNGTLKESESRRSKLKKWNAEFFKPRVEKEVSNK